MNDLGPWMKLYADIIYRKAHYSDHEFRILISAYSTALTLHGRLPARRALVAMWGEEEVAFLFAEGDLVENEDGSCAVHRWEEYQAPKADPTAAERQARWRERHPRVTRDVTLESVTPPSSSSTVTSSSSTETEDVPVAGWADEASMRFAAVNILAETITGRAYALGHNPGSKLMVMALTQVEDFGMDRVEAAWRKVWAEGSNGVRLTAGQLVIGADNYLRPIPKLDAKAAAAQDRAEAERLAHQRRLEQTQRDLRKYRGDPEVH